MEIRREKLTVDLLDIIVYLCGMRLEIEDLSIGYHRSIVQEHLQLCAGEGEMICLLGTNGSGKSTLLRTIAGLQPLYGGRILLCGRDLQRLSSQELARLSALVLTERTALVNTHVVDIVGMGRYPYSNLLGGMSASDMEQIEQAIGQCDLAGLRDRYFNSLSDGEKQRVLLAKAIAQQTPIVLLDEPTAHLDLPGRYRTFALLQEMAHEQGKTVVVSTHDLDLALQTADKLWLMKQQGGIVTGTPKELLGSGVFEEVFGCRITSLLSVNTH